MSPTKVLDAIRDLVIAAEETGWDGMPDLKPMLDAGREAYADLQIVMADADDGEGSLMRHSREELRDLADTAFVTMNWARRLGFGRDRQLDEVVKAFEVQLGYRKPVTPADEVAS